MPLCSLYVCPFTHGILFSSDIILNDLKRSYKALLSNKSLKLLKQIHFLHYKIFQNSLIDAIRFQTSWCSNGSQSQWKNGRNRTSEVQRKIWEGMEWFPCSAKHQLQDNWLPTVFWLSQECQEIQSLIHMCRIQQAEFIPLHKAWEQAPAVAKSTHHCTYMAKLISGIKSKRLVVERPEERKARVQLQVLLHLEALTFMLSWCIHCDS